MSINALTSEDCPVRADQPRRDYSNEIRVISRVAERNTPWMGMLAYMASMPVALVLAAAVFGIMM